MRNPRLLAFPLLFALSAPAQTPVNPAPGPIVLHAAHLLDVESGRTLTPGEVLIEGDHIVASGSSVAHAANARTIDLGDTTLLPGLIDAHVHLFLHPGAEDLQTVEESVPERTIIALTAAKADLLAGFTAERDMGTEGAGSADSAVRDAINHGLFPGPRMTGRQPRRDEEAVSPSSPEPPADCSRCAWVGRDALMQDYHDREWGVPERDPRRMWEALMLEGFQAGLAWITILRKREAFRRAFAGFDPVQVAGFGEANILRLLDDAGIVRSRAKIEATIAGARIFLAMAGAGRGFRRLRVVARGRHPDPG